MVRNMTTSRRSRGAALAAAAATALVLNNAPVHAQRIDVEEAERGVEYDWSSSSIGGSGSDRVVSNSITGGFDEWLSDYQYRDYYFLEIDALQDTDIESDRFTAFGATYFTFDAHPDVQGAHAEASAASSFYLLFKVDEAGPYDLSGSLSTQSNWNAHLDLKNLTTGDVLYSTGSGGSFDERFTFDTTSSYVCEISSSGSVRIDEPFASGYHFNGQSSFNVALTPGPNLSIEGDCPGPVTFTAKGMTPGQDVAFVYAWGVGSFLIANGPCAGVELGLSRTGIQIGATVPADWEGVAQLVHDVPPAACGRVHVQAIDMTTCTITDVEAL